MHYLEVQNVTKQYPGQDRPAISDISFLVNPGEILAILGPNGAGKTTLVKAILDLVEVSAGQIKIMEYQIQPTPPQNLFQQLIGTFTKSARRKGLAHVGAVLEDARNSDWALTVEENLRYFGTYQGADDPAAVIELLGLQDLRNQTAAKLSRGQKQILALAIALVHDPEILILDEPTLGLDVENAKKLESTLVNLAQQQNKAVIITTHVMELAQRIATKIMVINEGKIVALLPKEELLARFDLQGKKVELQVGTTLNDEITQTLHRQNIQIYRNNGTTKLLLEEGQQNEIDVYQMITSSGYQVDSMVKRQATLEEIFLNLIGDDTTNDHAK